MNMMRRTNLRLALIAATALGLALPAAAACIKPGGYDSLQAALIAEVNAARATRGLGALVENAALERTAQGQACDNAARQSISHDGSDGSRLDTRLKRNGYAFRTAAENTGRGFADARAAIDWWLNSSGHKKNILMARTNEVGVGIALSAAPDSRLHWVLVMAAR